MVIFGLLSLLWMSGCSSSTTEVPGPGTEELLARTWRVSRVFINGQQDVASSYGNFRLQFSPGGSYRWVDPTGNTTGGTAGDVRGSWSLNSDGTKVLLRNAAVGNGELTLSRTTDRNLDFTVVVTGFKSTAATFAFELVAP